MGTEELLESAFGDAAGSHYEWQTEGPYIGEQERQLIQRAFLPIEGRLLDLGCAEGATLYHLGQPAGAVGVDLFEGKLEFARKHLPKCEFVKASAYQLPFEDESFDHVIVRDVIHHIDEPYRAVGEIARVIKTGGRIDLLEPCRNNPMILMHALTKPEERGELRSTERFLSDIIAPHFKLTIAAHHQALPIHRLVFHPDMGRPEWGSNPLMRRWIRRVENLAERVLPRWSWAYVHVRGIKR